MKTANKTDKELIGLEVFFWNHSTKSVNKMVLDKIWRCNGKVYEVTGKPDKPGSYDIRVPATDVDEDYDTALEFGVNSILKEAHVNTVEEMRSICKMRLKDFSERLEKLDRIGAQGILAKFKILAKEIGTEEELFRELHYKDGDPEKGIRPSWMAPSFQFPLDMLKNACIETGLTERHEISMAQQTLKLLDEYENRRKNDAAS